MSLSLESSLKADRGQQFRRGIRDGIPIFIGYFAVSFAFGIQAADSSLTAFQAGLMSLLNLTSAGQLAGVQVIAAAGSYLEMVLVQFVINLRYLLMATALSQKMAPDLPTGPRLKIAYGVTDEIFGVSILKKGYLHPFYSYGLIFISTIGWVGGTVMGAGAGKILPGPVLAALGIALYGMFIAIVIPPAKRDHAVLFAVLAAMALSSVFQFAPVLKTISPGVRIMVITVLVSAFCALVWPRGGEDA